ncbi:MAG: hemolysin III family protein [Acidimicrobiales bacterium]|jgi:hemolysin III
MTSDEVIESPSFKPHWRGWLHAVGLPVLLGSSTALFLRARSGAQVAWILCFVLGVGSMLFTSAAYHRLNWSPQARRGWQRADHLAIFVAITGTYLAIIGLTMHGVIRLVVLLVFGAGTVLGILIRQLTMDTHNWVNTMPYLVMGWAAVAVMPQIYRGGGAACLWLIISGGVAYTLGALFLGLKRPRLWPRTFGPHELFHALTLVGAGCHFAAVYLALK